MECPFCGAYVRNVGYKAHESRMIIDDEHATAVRYPTLTVVYNDVPCRNCGKKFLHYEIYKLYSQGDGDPNKVI